MGKDRSFASKLAKGTKDSTTCSVCGEKYNIVKVISSEVKEHKDSWRFKEKFVGVCKCNENEIYS